MFAFEFTRVAPRGLFFKYLNVQNTIQKIHKASIRGRIRVVDNALVVVCIRTPARFLSGLYAATTLFQGSVALLVCMPWVRVTDCVVDTSTYRARAGSRANKAGSMSGPAQPTKAGEKTTPRRSSEEDPCTAHMPLKGQLDGDDEARKEWRTRMVFRDLLREFYPRYGVSLKDEFGDSFKAARTEPTFSAFPKPAVCGVGFC